MRPIIFVTSNKNKLTEAAAFLGTPVTGAHVEVHELQSMDLRVIIEHKTKEAFKTLGKPCITEDGGLFVDALRGFPGPFVKWWDQTIGYTKLAALLGRNRKAIFQTAFGYYDGKHFKLFVGTLRGTFTRKPRGTHGWGFDSWFIPKGSKRTLGQMKLVEKIQHSPRSAALHKLRKYLRSD